MSDPVPRPGVKFDMTINLGHILTFVGFVFTGFAIHTSLDKRVVVLEEARTTQAQLDRHQDIVMGQHMNQIRESLQDLKNGVQRLNDRIERKASER